MREHVMASENICALIAKIGSDVSKTYFSTIRYLFNVDGREAIQGRFQISTDTEQV